MEVTFTQSFFDSLKVLKRHNTWWYKTYDFFRRGLPEFIKNIYRFRKELWSHRWWDYRYTIQMFRRSLEIQEKGMRYKGIEESVSLNLKLYKMRRAIEIIKNIESETWFENAENILGKKASWSDDSYDWFSEKSEEQNEIDREILNLSHELQKKEWKELWTIIQGPDYDNFKYEDFDGSDLRTWWD